MVPTPADRWFDGWGRAFPETKGKVPDHSMVRGLTLPLTDAFYRFPHRDGSIQVSHSELLAFRRLYRLSTDDMDFYVAAFDTMRLALAEGRTKGREHSDSKRPKSRRRR